MQVPIKGNHASDQTSKFQEKKKGKHFSEPELEVLVSEVDLKKIKINNIKKKHSLWCPQKWQRM